MDEPASGCGKPQSLPDVQCGQVVLYIGSGGDIDCFTLAEQVGSTGRVVSLGTTPAMVAQAQKNVQEALVENVEVVVGTLSEIPVEDSTMDWVIASRAINLVSPDTGVSCELIRVLKPGGSLSIPATVAETSLGIFWSPRLEAIKCYPASVAREVTIEPAQVEDVLAVQALLQSENLPTDIQPHLDNFVVARHQGHVVGCSGMEVYGEVAVLRGLTIAPAYRRLNLGHQLLHARNHMAIQRGIKRGYMLTTTIAALVEAWGYHRIDRDQVPTVIQDTSEFQSDRCAAAVMLYRDFPIEAHTSSC